MIVPWYAAKISIINKTQTIQAWVLRCVLKILFPIRLFDLTIRKARKINRNNLLQFLRRHIPLIDEISSLALFSKMISSTDKRSSKTSIKTS